MSVCVRIGPRFSATCRSLYTVDGNDLRWSDSIRYLGVYLTSSRVLSCSLKYAKRSFYRAFNGVYSVKWVASHMSFYTETVVIELLKSKCMPILFYGLEVCRLISRISSLLITHWPDVLRRYFARTHRKLSLSVVICSTVYLLKM